MKLATLTYLASALAIGFGGGIAQAAEMAVAADKCDKAWSMASPGGDAISEGATVPFVLDYTMVDSDKDGAISKDEFNKACADGMVKADEATVKDME
ncbi:MAG: hypothetical protein ACRECX_11480 [Methyloceanibacter sp.]|uniref:hypothetical protein n=1 Tax=Methyloceanibacter sp. TaxID=1965321 RepID=UPI003D6CAAE0